MECVKQYHVAIKIYIRSLYLNPNSKPAGNFDDAKPSGFYMISMKHRLMLPLLLFCLITSLVCNADTFTVTTNADSGPGSLREAMQLAIDNGNSTIDYILFNIPDVSRAGRIIKLDSRLPDLSSNLVVDGTSQPGAAFGISVAKIQIERNGYDPNPWAFIGNNISDKAIDFARKQNINHQCRWMCD